MRAPRGFWPQWLHPVLVAALTALWTVAVVGSLAADIPTPFLVPLSLLVPLALAARSLFWKTKPSPAVLRATGWTILVTTALIAGISVPGLGMTVLAVPALLLVAVLCGRYPAQAVIAVVGVTASYGSLQAFTPIDAGPAADAVLAGLWISVIWGYLLRGRDRPIWLWPGVVAVLLYIFLTACEILTAPSISHGFYAFRGTAWYMLTFLLVGYGLWRPGTRGLVVKGVIVIAFLAGAYATFRLFVGPDSREQALAASADSTNFLNGKFRLVGSFLGGKALATWCSIMIPFCLAIGLSVKGHWRVLAGLACAGCAVGLLGSEVRSPLIGVVVGIGLVFLLFQLARAIPGLHLGVTATAVLAAALVGIGVFSFTGGSSEGSQHRYTLILTPTRDPAFQARLLRWRTVMVDIDRHPFGQGLGTASRIQRQRGRFTNIANINIDNSYLQIAFEQGLGVMLLFIFSALLMLFGLARRAIATAVRERAAVAIGACGGLAAYLAVLPTGSYVEGFNTLAVWTLVGLGVGQFAFPDEPGSREPIRT